MRSTISLLYKMSTTTPKSNHYDTIIIGAGISGLACASRLHEHLTKSGSKRKILVLEARDRLGGRIATETINGCRLDTGANWIHGIGTDERPNPLMSILPDKRVRSLNGSVAFEAPPPPKDRTVSGNGGGEWEIVGSTTHASQAKADVRTSHGSDLVIPRDAAGAMMGTMWQMFDDLHELANSTPADEAKRTTMLKAIARSETYRQAFDTVDPKYHDELKAIPQFVEGMEAAPLVAQSAEGKDDAPGMGLLEYAIEDFDGEQVFVRDGYLAVVEEVAKEVLQAGSVELGAEVEEIRWKTSPVSVKVKDGRTFEADNVISTFPLGVLKAKQERLFIPYLPKEKTEAISSLGFGTLDKIFMVYDRAWWMEKPFSTVLKKGLVRDPTGDFHGQSSSETPDILLGFTHALPGVAISPEDGSTAPGVRVLTMVNLDSLTGFPVLSCFISCSNAQQVEALPNSHAKQMLHDSLTTWFGIEPPQPADVHVTRWASDEFSRGSYSHMITGVSETDHRVEFKRSIGVDGGGSLGFAGEHTSKSHFATVHGALISGWREADRILEKWKASEM